MQLESFSLKHLHEDENVIWINSLGLYQIIIKAQRDTEWKPNSTDWIAWYTNIIAKSMIP